MKNLIKQTIILAIATSMLTISCKKEGNYPTMPETGINIGNTQELALKAGEYEINSFDYVRAHNDFKIAARVKYNGVRSWKLKSGNGAIIIHSIPETLFEQSEYRELGSWVSSTLILTLSGKL